MLSESRNGDDSFSRKRMKPWIVTLTAYVYVCVCVCVCVRVCVSTPFLLLAFFISRVMFWILTLRTYMPLFPFSLSPFTCILRIAFLSQVSEWKSCTAAWGGQQEHFLWIPTAAAQTLRWMYKEPACGQQGTVWSG